MLDLHVRLQAGQAYRSIGLTTTLYRRSLFFIDNCESLQSRGNSVLMAYTLFHLGCEGKFPIKYNPKIPDGVRPRMEDGGSDEMNFHSAELINPVNPASSSLMKCFDNEVLAENSCENEESSTKIESLDPIISNNKVNGDCGLESSSSASLDPPNSNHSNVCKETAEADNEISKTDDEKENDCENQEISSISVQAQKITDSTNPNEERKNLTKVKIDERVQDSELVEPNLSMKTLLINKDMTSISEDQNTSNLTDLNLSHLVKNESKSGLTKAKKSSSDVVGSIASKSNDVFKTPLRYDLKSTTKAKTNDGVMISELNQKQNDKNSDRTNRNSKRKNDEKIGTSNAESNENEKFPIQYKGFKKKIGMNLEKRVKLKWNPFNPACKSRRKSTRSLPSRLPIGEEIDCSTLQQSEYAQYLGLQPILKFRCSNCGSSAFQSMVALNTHQMECTKSGKGRVDKTLQNLPNPAIEPKSTNIKLTRKVFLCSACGTYYEHWNLFLHMREVHRRYICLYCLSMFSIAEKLSEHLIQKHKVSNQNFSNLEDFQKNSYQTFFLLCLTCDKVFSEMDDFYGHVCTVNKKTTDAIESSNKSEAIANQEAGTVPHSESCTNIASNKTGTKKVKENSKKNAASMKALQTKKDETVGGNSVAKPDEISVTTSDAKNEGNNQCEDNVEKTDSVNYNSININENISEVNMTIPAEVDVKPPKAEDVPESHLVADPLPPVDKVKVNRKNKSFPKRTIGKRKKIKEKEEETGPSSPKIKKNLEEPTKDMTSAVPPEANPTCTATSEQEEIKEELNSSPHPEPSSVEQTGTADIEDVEIPKDVESALELGQEPPAFKEETNCGKEESISALTSIEAPAVSPTTPVRMITEDLDSQNKFHSSLLKFKLPGVESDGESDDSQKLSLVVDENTHSDPELKTASSSGDICSSQCQALEPFKDSENNALCSSEKNLPDVTLASEDVPVMALTLDDKIENVSIQTVLKECVRTSCMSCNYCRHAVKIAVNGKQLALHILSEHRFMPIKNETPVDVITKLKTSLESLQTMFFNTETYDSSDVSIHVPYDQDSSFDCFQCNYVTTTHRDLFAHKRKSHTKSLLLCIMCKSNFYSYSELLCHLCPGTYNAEIQFHNVDINFRCCLCRLDTIPSAFRLMVHLRKTHHTCDICLENGLDQQKLSTHMWKHKLNHLCYRCGIAYASKPDITKHLFWKHGTESVLCKKCLQKKWPHVYHFCIPPTSFICEECNTSFSKAVALKVHKRIHGNDFPYKCIECSKTFISKKLLHRHEERHTTINSNTQNINEVGNEEEQKDEIINVSDVPVENKISSPVAEFSDSKEIEHKDKSHKKHKKDKERKDKQVVDVYDLPPLNLSSESDSSDEDVTTQESTNNTSSVPMIITEKGSDDSQKETISSKELENNSDLIKGDDDINQYLDEKEKIDILDDSLKLPSLLEGVLTNSHVHHSSKDLVEDDKIFFKNEEFETKNDEDVKETEEKVDISSNEKTMDDNNEVEDIWKNFYSTNPQNSNLPYPLCAIKSEIAYGIIMGDHDYCHKPFQESTFREDLPSTSGISVPLINDRLEEDLELNYEKINETALLKEATDTPSPSNSPKKKPKSPKKKITKVENENNSSSSSDSSSESSSSSCSCGPNCSCSSSSSNSSSSSSSESESSGAEEGLKQERKRKKRERRCKTKSDHETEIPKEHAQTKQPENTLPTEPVDPPIRESELETDETTSDEEFYDQQPQKIANQLLAEKRNQLMLLASAANVNNGNISPSPLVDVIPQGEPMTKIIKQKVKTKRKRKVTAKGKSGSDKNTPNSHLYSQYQKDIQPINKPVQPYHNNQLIVEPKLPPFSIQTPTLTETTGSGSETEKSRSSKRRRIPNKFYGYSSGDEEEKPAPSPKWRKQETISHPRVVPPAHPPTPRIQLTVPKQVIRKPYKFQKSAPPKPPQPSSSDSTDSGNELERTPQVPPLNQNAPTATASQKNEKDVYCYCRCPYDEVSEMIACDDANCEIEWFHFECVGILVPPRGQWYCPGCRKARGLPT